MLHKWVILRYCNWNGCWFPALCIIFKFLQHKRASIRLCITNVSSHFIQCIDIDTVYMLNQRFNMYGTKPTVIYIIVEHIMTVIAQPKLISPSEVD